MESGKVNRAGMRYGKNRSPLLLIIIILLAVLLVALIGAGIWQAIENKDPGTSSSESSYIEDEPSSEEEVSSEPESSSAASSSASSSSASSSSSGSSSSGTSSTSTQGNTGDIDQSFFSNTVFIGDSITDGIKAYQLLSEAVVLANTGLNPYSALTSANIKTSNGYVTVLQALSYHSPEKIFLMLGSNGIAWFTEGAFIRDYGTMVDSILEMHPNANLYIQSILPVTAAYSNNAANKITNDKIDRFNELLRDLAAEKGVTYLHVASVFKDENGALPNSASPSDGMHFGPSYYKKWFAYLQENAV